MTTVSARLVAATVLILAVSACDILGLGQECHHGISYEVTPEEVTLTIGESFEPIATMESCPEGRRQLQLHWSAEDPSVVTVDPESGVTTGVDPGSTRLVGSEQQGEPILEVAVTVVE